MSKGIFQEICKGNTVEINSPVDKSFLDGRGDADYVPKYDGSINILDWGRVRLR
jgi:hypothetical protein